MTPRVHVVSHGPHCLDGVAAAVAVARYYEGEAEVVPHFASNSEVDAVLRGLVRDPSRPEELWITDISWKEPDTDAHLARLAADGMRIHWVDHHRTALERFRTGEVRVPFAERVLSEEYAASRLVYEHLARKLAAEGRTAPRFAAFAPVVAMADDNDRWLHRVPGSRELAWVVRALGPDAYPDLLAIDERVTYTPRMEAARARVGAEIARSLAVARASRVERRVGGLTLVSAVCDGHPSEVADAWGRETPGAVFALYDAKSLTVSLRRSPDATVDLSRSRAPSAAAATRRPQAASCPSCGERSPSSWRTRWQRSWHEARPHAHRARRARPRAHDRLLPPPRAASRRPRPHGPRRDAGRLAQRAARPPDVRAGVLRGGGPPTACALHPPAPGLCARVARRGRRRRGRCTPRRRARARADRWRPRGGLLLPGARSRRQRRRVLPRSADRSDATCRGNGAAAGTRDPAVMHPRDPTSAPSAPTSIASTEPPGPCRSTLASLRRAHLGTTPRADRLLFVPTSPTRPRRHAGTRGPRERSRTLVVAGGLRRTTRSVSTAAPFYKRSPALSSRKDSARRFFGGQRGRGL